MSCKKEPFQFNLSQLRMLGKDCKIAKRRLFASLNAKAGIQEKNKNIFLLLTSLCQIPILHFVSLENNISLTELELL